MMSDYLENIPSVIRVAYGRVMVVSTSGEDICLLGKAWNNTQDRFKQIILHIPHQGVMHRRSLFEQHGQFDESFLITGDNELLLRELKTGDAFFINDIILTAMRQGGVSTGIKNSLIIMRETTRAGNMHGQTLSKTFWLMAMAKAYIRLLLMGVLGEQLLMKLLNFYSRFKRSMLFGMRKF